MPRRSAPETARVAVGVGGWTFAPWRGVFYPPGLPHARELEHASRALGSIEINGTFYSTFRPATWRKWRDATPEGFVFSVKASRYCTTRPSLAEARPAIERFLGQGLTELGAKLGPINWQLPARKRFESAEIDAFLSLLPKEQDGVALRHALEARHASFAAPEARALARRHGVAFVLSGGPELLESPESTADFAYARIVATREEVMEGLERDTLARMAKHALALGARGDLFLYFIRGAKVRNPSAARALIEEIEMLRARPTRAPRSRRSAPLR